MSFVLFISALMVPLIFAVIYVPLTLALRAHRAEQRANVARAALASQEWSTAVVREPVLVYGA